ncbi:MAG: DUF2520 domain-containing protein [Gordonia sp. (in: high G+C Gram-positive bacteria)]|uniref:Rossmann-like and DUF2520 domain-containing protein n=1 Tax=Gordonia sp. (in: high G+C Gram-positive bacteria) TaxID=84139 RepID=UPI0039E59FA5
MTASTPAPRLNVGIVSAGRVGTALGEALAAAGHRVVAVHARSEASRERAERRLPSARPGSVDDVVAAADLVLLAVPDTELPTVIDRVAVCLRPGQIVVHTAGAHGTAILDPVARRGGMVLAIHPAMTFVGGDEDTPRLASSCFGITSADPFGDAVAASLVLEIGGTPVRIDESQRTLYHAALAHGANNLIALVTDAVTALRAAIDGPHRLAEQATVDGGAAGLPEQILGPLVRASLENVLALGPSALTGPVARGDRATVQRHRTALEGLPDPGVALGYRVLSARAATQAGAPADLLDSIEGNP